MIFKAIIHTAEEGGFWAEVPALPGCVTQGDTKAELELNLREAIEGWLAAGQDELTTTANDQILELAI
jgi:predicted RNase H-like HicB family nuclease